MNADMTQLWNWMFIYTNSYCREQVYALFEFLKEHDIRLIGTADGRIHLCVYSNEKD